MLPETAVEAVVMLLVWASGVFGVGSLTNVLVEALKRVKLPFLGEGEKVRLGGLWAEAAAILVAGLLSWAAAGYLDPFAVYLDQSGLWAVIAAAAVPVARWLYWQRKQAGA